MLCVVLGRTEDTATNIFLVLGGAGEPQSGFPDGAGVGAAAGGVVQFLDKVVDVPVVVHPVVFEVFSQDGEGVLQSRSSTRTG